MSFIKRSQTDSDIEVIMTFQYQCTSCKETVTEIQDEPDTEKKCSKCSSPMTIISSSTEVK